MMRSPVLHDALASVISIPRQGMSTWMMQYMSNSASAKIQQVYADEIMTQQI